MRVAIVTESFLPTVNGVTTSVCRVLEHLALRGHDAVLIAPIGAPASYAGFPVVTVPALAYRQFPVGIPSPVVQRAIADFAPDVVHAASPFVLGAQGLAAARRLGVPSVAIYQTDLAGYARRHRLGRGTAKLAERWVRRVHESADLTLAPSSAALADLAALGLDRLAHWARGVDLAGFHPNRRQDADVIALREQLSPRGEVVVGYVGRIAPEKRVDRLRALRGLPGIRLAITGDGPADAQVRTALAGMPVTWLGRRDGRALQAAYAALDVFVHTGTEETFGQTIQEAHATGVPVVAPRAGGPIDLVDHGRSGLLYEPEDDRRLAEAVEALAVDAGLRGRMGEAGRRAVLARSWEVVGDELLAHYEGVAASARRAPRPVGRTGAAR